MFMDTILDLAVVTPKDDSGFGIYLLSASL